uniref:Uncharacterized protein n=1 Tax=Romanomermis culicivorax TaxID=13658 RepID=A0A915KAE9_ROMCU
MAALFAILTGLLSEWWSAQKTLASPINYKLNPFSFKIGEYENVYGVTGRVWQQERDRTTRDDRLDDVLWRQWTTLLAIER